MESPGKQEQPHETTNKKKKALLVGAIAAVILIGVGVVVFAGVCGTGNCSGRGTTNQAVQASPTGTTPEQTLQDEPSSKPSPKPSPKPSLRPTLQPSLEPIAADVVASPPPSNPPVVQIVFAPSSAPSWDPTPEPTTTPFDELFCPAQRYAAWSSLEASMNDLARGLGYTECSWNIPFTAYVEYYSWDYLTVDQQTNATIIGFNQESWDCWQNHYDDYEWSDLLPAGVQSCFEDLGWDVSSWNETTVEPASEAKMFDELTPAEQAAAECICYPKTLWDAETLKSPNFDGSFCGITSSATEATQAPTAVCTAQEIWAVQCPQTRYDPFNDLAKDMQNSAKQELGYTKDTWNSFGDYADVEAKYYESLSADETAAANELGFDEMSWECYQHHFADYYWFELAEVHVQDCYSALGYDEDLWNNDEEVASSDNWFADLTPEQQKGAECVCYFESIWNEFELGKSFEDSFCL